MSVLEARPEILDIPIQPKKPNRITRRRLLQLGAGLGLATALGSIAVIAPDAMGVYHQQNLAIDRDLPLPTRTELDLAQAVLADYGKETVEAYQTGQKLPEPKAEILNAKRTLDIPVIRKQREALAEAPFKEKFDRSMIGALTGGFFALICYTLQRSPKKSV